MKTISQIWRCSGDRAVAIIPFDGKRELCINVVFGNTGVTKCKVHTLTYGTKEQIPEIDPAIEVIGDDFIDENMADIMYLSEYELCDTICRAIRHRLHMSKRAIRAFEDAYGL